MKILLLDIETSPIISYTWGLFDQNVGLNQVAKDWHILAFAAKWLDDPKMHYYDQRYAKDVSNDSKLLKKAWELLNEADIVISQNGRRFDTKKLNARFVLNGMQPPSSYRQIDTLEIAKKHFAFTSNKLAYMSDKLCKKYKKLEHKEFPGFELWSECLKGNMKAWKEMERYNKHDVLSLEELYSKLSPWDNTNLNTMQDSWDNLCKCGNKEYVKNGFKYSQVGKFQRFKCTNCGHETRSRTNLLSIEKKKALCT